MKKILAFILCAVILLCGMTMTASAEESVNTSTEEIATESEASPPETEADKTVTEMIVEYVQSHVEEISVIGTLILTIFYEIRKHKNLNGSIGTLNKNAIAIAENSATSIQTALSGVEDVAKVVDEYKEEIANLLDEIRKSAEEKKSLEKTLSNVEAFLKIAKNATLELSNEVAELLVLANIPTSKKDELYARHTKAVKDIEAAEEVMSDEGKNQ